MLFGFVEGRKCFFIEPHCAERFFERGHFYGSADDVERFAFFSKAALEFILKSGKRPQVIHCHDWQTALVPVLLFEIYQHIGLADQRVCYTVHNFSHQGVCGEPVLWATGLCSPKRFYDYNRLRDNLNPSAINLMKGGIVGTVNLSNPRAIFAGSPPRFTRSRVTYEAYAVSRTSTRPQVDSAVPSIWSDGGTVSHENLASLSTAPNRRRKSTASASF